MALPIKPKDTQDNCNPVSSNCIIWQGPDIPCINLCNGDSVSDVVAKMAERLCTITEQLDISLLDLSCFNPIYPTPQDFQDVMQLILDKICALENPTLDPSKANDGCPDDCIVTIAPCFQEVDFLGNAVTTLPLKDYVIKIGNELCGLIATVNSLNTAIQDLEGRVTIIEDTCCNAASAIEITTTGCVGNGVTQPIQSFLSQFEAAFCALQEITGGEDLVDIQDTLQNLCLTGNEDQLTPQISNPTASIPLNSLADWYDPVSNTAQALNNLYLAFCDLRTYVGTVVPSLVDSINQCCGVTCADLVYTVTAVGIVDSKFIRVTPSGDTIPPGFTYCAAPPSKVRIQTMAAVGAGNYPASVGTNDIIAAINNGTAINPPQGFDVDSIAPGASDSIWFEACLDLCITDGTLTCNSTRCYDWFNTDICNRMGVTIATSPSTTTSGIVSVSWERLNLPTQYTIQLYSTNGPYGNPATVSYPNTGSATYTYPAAVPAGTTYWFTVTACQTLSGIGTKCTQIPCQTGTAFVVGTTPPPDIVFP